MNRTERWLIDKARMTQGFYVDSRVRSEMAIRWNRLRVGVSGAAIVSGTVVGLLGFNRAWVAVAGGLLTMVHSIATRKRPQVNAALAVDITTAFLTLEILAVHEAFLILVEIVFTVIVVLLCTPLPRVVLAVFAMVCAMTAVVLDFPGTGLADTWWSAVSGWITGAVFMALLLAVVSVVIDQVQSESDKLAAANRRLEELAASKDDLIVAISHEIRTPLTGVLGFATELNEGWDSFRSEQRKELAGRIAGLSTDIEHLTEDLTIAARNDLGTLVTRRESVELHGEVLHFLDLYGRAPKDFEVIGEPCHVEVDRPRLRQVLRSLLSNALAHGGEHVWMEVSGVADGGAVRVCDDGDGIPDEYRDQVFAPFERRRRTLATPMGLGLAIARGLAEVMGGTLTYRRATGTTIFELILPSARRVGDSPTETPTTISEVAGYQADTSRTPPGTLVAEQIRTELGGRWNRLRLGTTVAMLGVTVTMGLLGFQRAWSAAGFVLLMVIHALLTRDRSEVSVAMALDITVVFAALDIAAVTPPVLAIAYLSFGVEVTLLCTPLPRVLLSVLATTVCIATVALDFPGTAELMGTGWSIIGGWIVSVVLVLQLLGMMSVVINLLASHVDRHEEANRRLQALVAAKDDLIAAISHEIRTPLTGVLGFATELHQSWDSFSVEERKELVGQIAMLSNDIKHIAQDLIVAARADLGTLVTRRESVELRGEVLRFLGQYGQTPKGFEVIGEPCHVEVDRLRLRQILRSLLSNAVDHGGAHVWMEVSGVPDGGAVRVCDDGDGIPDEYRDQMFAPYERLHRNPTLAASMGLGLAIARGLAEVMGGTLTYRRTPDATIFELILPHARRVPQYLAEAAVNLPVASNL